MPSWKILKELLEDYYSSNDSAVAWSSAFCPTEILQSLDIKCFYPESLAAALSGSNKNTMIIDSSKSRGYSENICSYALLFAGRGEQRSKYRNVPDPDILVATNNQCGTILYWWESLQAQYNVPLQFIHYPKCEGEFSVKDKKYIVDQYMMFINYAEKKFGKKLNYDKLGSTIENAMRATEVWQKIQNLRKENYIPPRIFTDALLPLVVMKGDSRAVDYYEELLKEIRFEYSGNTVEKKLLWLGYPFWFLKEKYPLIHSDAGIVADIYTSWWILDYSGESPMEKLVNAYGKTFLNMPLEWKTRYVEKIISEHKIDGVIIHLNKSCKRDSISLVLINEHLRHNLNMPTLIIESDMANPDWHNSENIQFNIDAFLEML